MRLSGDGRSVDWLVVGSGLTGATFARTLAERTDDRVLVVDRRKHVGGNVYDAVNVDGVRVQRYGAHILHTSSTAVWQFLSRFTAWYPYEHRVLAAVGGTHVPVPFNFTSLRALLPQQAELFERDLRAEFPVQARVPVSALLTASRRTVRELGEFVLDTIFRSYTAKQWGRPVEQLDSSVLSRVPVTLSHDDRYFRDNHQAIPLDGYTAMVDRMLDHPQITVAVEADGKAAQLEHPNARVLWTGQIDDYFDHRFGALPYRSLRFEHRHDPAWRALPVAVVNHPGPVPYTRIIDHTHFSPRRSYGSTLTFEYPSPYVAGENEPFYPVLDDGSRATQSRYQLAASELDGRVLFAGRLGDFRYYDMHQAIGRALTLAAAVLDGRPDPHAVATLRPGVGALAT